MITTLVERKVSLLSQIEKLKEEIDELRRLGYGELALCGLVSSVRYFVTDRLGENLRN